jgi:hypothetical protein
MTTLGLTLRTLGLTLVTVLVGLLAISADGVWDGLRAPPAWAFDWVQWIAAGWALSFGPRILNEVVGLLRRRNSNPIDRTPGPTVVSGSR